MPRQLLVALWLFAAMGVGVAFLVWAVTKTIPVVTRAYDAGALIARRRELLKRGDDGTLTEADLDEMVALTKDLRGKMTADHVVASLERELEALEIARLAFRRGDARGTTASLSRVARTFIGAGEWRPDAEA